MKKFFATFLMSTLLLSTTALAGVNTQPVEDGEIQYAQEPVISVDHEVIPGLIPLPEDYPVPEEISKRIGRKPDGFYINGDGVAARRPYGLDAPIIGRLYTGDIIWTSHETARADGYKWIHVDTDRNSNMGAVPDVWIVVDFLGEPWSIQE